VTNNFYMSTQRQWA